MSPEEVEALLKGPRPMTVDRPGLWEFTHHDGHTEQIRVKVVDLDHDWKVLEPTGTEWPDMTLREMELSGAFTRYLGP